MSEEDDPPGLISVKAVSQDGNEVHFKIKKKTPLKKLMDAYCLRFSVPRSSVRFLLDGERINDESTAEQLEMEDEDIIDIVMEQTGGALHFLEPSVM